MTGNGLTAQRGSLSGQARSATDRSTGEGSRDSHWLASVLRQFEGPLTLYAARITRDVERARDVVQEAFLRLLAEDRDTIEPHLAEWLYTVCRNKALDVRRKESRMTPLSDTAADIEPSRDAAPDESLERQESTAKALRYLSRLPDNQQEVIRLKFQHGLSYKQISTVTNLSVTNVGFLIHTGLKTLRHRMGVEAT
jgi:RNA polymerase sigma factor (sigma-70 family)